MPQKDGSTVTTLLVLGFMLGFVLAMLGFLSVVKEAMEPCITGAKEIACNDRRVLVPVGLGIIGGSLAGLIVHVRRRRRKAGWETSR